MKPPVFDTTWSEEVKRVYQHDQQELWDATISPHIFNMYQNQLALYQSLVPESKSRILDVGCAQATLAILLAEQGHSVIAMDLRQDFLDYAASRYTHGDIEFKCGNALDLANSSNEGDSPDTRYDIIFANQIIEHLVHPEQLVFGLKKLLRPAGKLIITTPNHSYFKNTLPTFTELGDVKQWEDKQFTADGDGHFFAYTNDELLAIFEQCNLTEISTRFYESPWISGHMKFRYLHKFMPYAALSALNELSLKMPWANKISHQLMIIGHKPR
ncbi:MAG: class I SAM-dependent methyltransferase [Arenicella sp.]